MSIGENIRRLREQHGLTQRELGEIAGVSDKAVSTWELGIKEPRLGAVARIAAHFGVSKSAILDDTAPASAFAAVLEQLCAAWGRTPERLERDLGFSHGRLLMLRRGTASPTAAELDTLSAYFRTPRAVLLGETVLPEGSNVAPLPPERGIPSPRPRRVMPPLSYTPVGSSSFGTSLRDERAHIIPLSVRRRIPVLGRVPAGVPIEAVTDVVEELELDTRLSSSGYDYFGLLVTGDSMYPEYRDGDIVILRVQSTAETGDDVVAYIGGSDATLKRLTVTENGIQLRPLNPDYAARSFTRQEVLSLPVTIAGVVVEQRRTRRR